MQWNPKALLRETRQAILDSHQQDYFVTRQRERIAGLIRAPRDLDLRSTIQLLSSMGVYGTWLAMKGAIAVCDGNEDGWHDIHGSFLYRAWDIRVAVAQADRRKTGQFLLRDRFAGRERGTGALIDRARR